MQKDKNLDAPFCATMGKRRVYDRLDKFRHLGSVCTRQKCCNGQKK